MKINNDYNFDFNKIKKTIVNYVVVIFGIIIILIFMLLVLYYLTPNNYEIINLDNTKFKFQEKIDLTIEPDSLTKINILDKNNVYLKFPAETNLVIKNIFKSQNIFISNDNELIRPRYNSEIFLINNSKFENKITVQFYLII